MTERLVRDVIDDIMVRIAILESEIAAISRQEKYKGRIMRIFYTIEDIRDLLVELKARTRDLCRHGQC